MENEFISIIIPVYNAEKYIRRCVESVLNQTFKNYEVVVIDDGSTDATKDILKKMEAGNERVTVYSTVHLGVSAARNKGLEVSRGKYIAFVDADDEVSPFYLENLFGILNKYQAQIAVCGIYHVCSEESYVQSHLFNKVKQGSIRIRTGKEFLLKMEEPFRYEKTAVCWNKLYKRDVFDGINYPSGRIYEDSAMMQDILYPVQKIAETDEILYFYHTETIGITRSPYHIGQLNEVLFAKKRMHFFRKKKERELYVLARKQYCIALLKHYYLSKKNRIVSKSILLRLQQEQKRYLKGLGWKKKLPLKISLVFDAGRYIPFLCGALIVWWDTFLEKRYRTRK